MAAVRPTSEPSVKIFIGPRRSQSSPKPGPQPEVDAYFHAVGRVGAERMEGVADDHQLNPDVQPALLSGGGVGGGLDRGLTDPAAADACLGDRGDALSQVPAAGRVDGGGQRGQRVGADQVPDELLGALFEQAGGAAGRVDGDPAAVGWRNGLADAEVGQHQAVDHAHVARRVLEPDPVVRRDRVERGTVRVGAAPVLVVAGPDDPLPLGGARGLGRHPRVKLILAAGPQVDLGQRQPEPDHVVVRVVEPGDKRPPAQVDDLLGGHVRLPVIDPDDAPARHRDRAGRGPARVHGEHIGADEQQVGFVGHGSKSYAAETCRSWR
jgi:hypothetical protein